jgi:hypothetical protein
MKNMLLVVVLFFAVFVLMITNFEPTGKVYDCGMAEWHPDIPKEVKEECRRRHYEEWKKNNTNVKYQT